MKFCILNPKKICDHCGECDDRCELDPTKTCDNCFRCLELDDRAYAKIQITGVLTEVDEDAFELAPMQWENPKPICFRTLPGVRGRWKQR